MKSILISIKPRFVAKILNGEKTVEVRKSMPRCDLPIDVYIYCTKSNYLGFVSKRYAGKVVAKFTLNKVEEIKPNIDLSIMDSHSKELIRCADLSLFEGCEYLKWNIGYAWHISNLVIFDKPKELSEFYQYKFIEDTNITHKERHFRPYLEITKAPQSWCYIESENDL